MKQKFRDTFKNSGYFIATDEKKDVDRYSDRLKNTPAPVVYDKTLFPRELFDDEPGSESEKKACNFKKDKKEINFEKEETSKSRIEEDKRQEEEKVDLEAKFNDEATTTDSDDLDHDMSVSNYREHLEDEEVDINDSFHKDSSDEMEYNGVCNLFGEDTDYTRSYIDDGEEYLQDEDCVDNDYL